MKDFNGDNAATCPGMYKIRKRNSLYTRYVLYRIVLSKLTMFQTALGPMHPGNSDGIDARVLTRLTVVLSLGMLEKTNYLEYKVSFEFTDNLNNK